MRNNNRAIIKKLTKRSLMSNKKRNFFIIAAITLTTLLLASVFSIGMSFFDSLRMQQVRLMGTVAHAAVSRPSSGSLERLYHLDYVKTVGTGNHVALVKETPQMGDMNLSLHYFDKTEWEELRSPAFTDVTGNYPQNEHEIMVPRWVLDRLEIDPIIGMEIPISYTVDTDGVIMQYDEVFTLSGWFTSYMHIRSGNIDSLVVSEALSRKHGKTTEADGAASVVFDNASHVVEYCDRLKEDLELFEEQDVRPVPMYDNSDGSMSALVALLLIVVFLMFTGYLLIYNVLYISVARDVRFYGLLKTVGTTPRQLRRIVTGQILRLCAVGIPLGAALASLLSLAGVPALVSGMSTIATGTVVSFSPLIYVGATIFALLTALLGAAKPAKKAASVSPIEAQKYTGVEIRKRSVRSSAHGKPYRMALRNIFRDRKRAAVVLLSLFLGITTFITVTTLVASMNTDNYVASYVKNDFILKNNTINIGSDAEAKQKFDDTFLSAISDIPGFESAKYDTEGWFRLTYTDGFDAHLANRLDEMPNQGSHMMSPEAIADIKEKFTCVAVGVDSSALKELEGDFDIEAFERGEYLLLSTREPALYDAIESVEIRSDLDENVKATVPVGGFAPIFFHNHGYSLAPTLIMSNNLMDRLTGGAIRTTLYINIEEGFDAQYLDALEALTDGDYEISRESKLEAREELRGTKIMLYILGGGIASVLGLIGVLNFVNVMSVGIMVRKRELAALESMGMSRKQMRSMLLCEGAGYALITLVLVSVAGNALTYVIFKLFQQEAGYAVFTYPVIPVIITVLAILTICIVTPEAAYRSISKMTIVERLREAE